MCAESGPTRAGSRDKTLLELDGWVKLCAPPTARQSPVWSTTASLTSSALAPQPSSQADGRVAQSFPLLPPSQTDAPTPTQRCCLRWSALCCPLPLVRERACSGAPPDMAPAPDKGSRHRLGPSATLSCRATHTATPASPASPWPVWLLPSLAATTEEASYHGPPPLCAPDDLASPPRPALASIQLSACVSHTCPSNPAFHNALDHCMPDLGRRLHTQATRCCETEDPRRCHPIQFTAHSFRIGSRSFCKAD